MVTKSTSFEETDEFIRGRNGERLVADYLRRKGWYVIPSYDYSGDEHKAPRLTGLLDSFVIPDLDVSRCGNRQWAEVKTKWAASFTHVTQQFEHGLPARHFNHYHAVQHVTGCPVHVFIFEESTGELLHSKLESLLCPRVSRMKKEGVQRELMVYFPRSAFAVIHDWLEAK